MVKLIHRAEDYARAQRVRVAAQVAERLSGTIRGATVSVEEARVVVSGKGLIKRWLIDPELRFLSGDRK